MKTHSVVQLTANHIKATLSQIHAAHRYRNECKSYPPTCTYYFISMKHDTQRRRLSSVSCGAKRWRGERKRKKELIIDIIIFEFNPKRRNRAIQYLMNLFYMHDFLWYRWVGAVLSSTLCSALPCTWYAHISIHPINFTMCWNESIIFTMHTNQNDLIGIFHILFRFVWLLLYLTLSLYPSFVHSSCF